MNKCQKCGYEWQSRGTKKPVSCPRCKSYKWDEQKPVKAEFANAIKAYEHPSQIFDTFKKREAVSTCQDCGDPCEVEKIRCAGCQKEFEYEQGLKGKE